MRHFKWRALSPRGRGDSGQTLAEFALVGSLLILFLFSILDFGFLFYSQLTLQNAVRQAGRYTITGNCGADGSGGANCFVLGPADRLHMILQTVSDYSFGLSPTVTVACIQGNCPGYAGGLGNNNAGGPGDTVRISAQYTYQPLILTRFFTGGSYTFTVSATFRNESFSPPAS